MRVFSKLVALSLIAVAVAAVGLVGADEISGTDAYEPEVFVTNTTQQNAAAAKADIEAGVNLPTWKGPVTLANVGDNYTVTAMKLRIVTRTLGQKTLTSPSPTSKKIEWHTARLTPGVRYVIELKSGTGATSLQNGVMKALPGFFDPMLLVEDDRPNGQGQRQTLPGGTNDDISWPANCNSRVTITAPASGVVRIVVTSFNNGESGPYTIEIRGAD